MLHFIVHRDRFIIQKLLNLEPPLGQSILVNMKCPHSGTTLLHQAIRCEDPTLIAHLLKLGADITQTNHTGQNALDLAEHCVNTSIAIPLHYMHAGNRFQLYVQQNEMLLASSLRQYVNYVRPTDGATALHLCLFPSYATGKRDQNGAMLDNDENARRIRILLAWGADVLSTDHELVRPIDYLPINHHNLKTRPLCVSSTIGTLLQQSGETNRPGMAFLPKQPFISLYSSLFDEGNVASIRTKIHHALPQDQASDQDETYRDALYQNE